MSTSSDRCSDLLKRGVVIDSLNRFIVVLTCGINL